MKSGRRIDSLSSIWHALATLEVGNRVRWQYPFDVRQLDLGMIHKIMGRMNTSALMFSISTKSSLSLKIKVPEDRQDYALISKPSEAAESDPGPDQ